MSDTQTLSDSESDIVRFREEGITFSRIPVSRTAEVCEFIGTYFFPDEPYCRSLGIKRSWLSDMFMSDPIRGGSCTMATDTDDKIIGVRLADVYTRNSWYLWLVDMFLCHVFPKIAWLLGLSKDPWVYLLTVVFPDLFTRLGFDIWKMFDRFKCEKILHAVLICTASTVRKKGLGAALLRYTEQQAVQDGCTVTVAFTTGIYSGRMFARSGYRVIGEVRYEDFRDPAGNLYLEDPGEHTASLLQVKDFRE